MNDWKNFYDKIADIKFTMLVTHDSSGKMQSRPFTTQAAGHDGAVWFFTRRDAEAATVVERDPEVLLCYADPSAHRFISCRGEASLSHDRQLIEQWWNPAYKIFFPEGRDDPLLVLMRVHVSKADIWDSDASKMSQLFEMGKAALGMDVDTKALGEHQVLNK